MFLFNFQIEEINFREDDISPEMIPVPQKKGRGRPRKYLRLEDVLEWRQRKEKARPETEERSEPEVGGLKRKLDENGKDETKKLKKEVPGNDEGQPEEDQQQLGQQLRQRQLQQLEQEEKQMEVNRALTDLSIDKMAQIDENLNHKFEMVENNNSTISSNNNSSSGSNNSSKNNSSHSGNNSSSGNDNYYFNIDNEADEVECQGFLLKNTFSWQV